MLFEKFIFFLFFFSFLASWRLRSYVWWSCWRINYRRNLPQAVYSATSLGRVFKQLLLFLKPWFSRRITKWEEGEPKSCNCDVTGKRLTGEKPRKNYLKLRLQNQSLRLNYKLIRTFEGQNVSQRWDDLHDPNLNRLSAMHRIVQEGSTSPLTGLLSLFKWLEQSD